MKPGLFIDTGFWIALLDRRDRNHERAKDSLGAFLTGYRIYVSDFVVFETMTYFNCSLHRHDLAVPWEQVRALCVHCVDRPCSAGPAFHAGACAGGITPRRQAAEEFSHKGTKTQRRRGMITPRRQARQGRPGVMCTCHLHSEELDLGELGALA